MKNLFHIPMQFFAEPDSTTPPLLPAQNML